MMEWYQKNQNALDYWPTCLKEKELFKGLAKGIDKGINEYKNYVGKILGGYYPYNASLNIIRRYEKIFGLSSDCLSLSERRMRIITLCRQRAPVNEVMLKNMLSVIMGNIIKIEKGNDDYTCIVKYREQANYHDVDYGLSLLRKIIPANLELQVLYAYTEWQDIAQAKWSEIHNYTWGELMTGKNNE